MGRYTPAWAVGFAVGLSVVVLGVAIDRPVILLGGLVVTLGSLGGQAFVPGPPTEEEREREEEVRGAAVGTEEDDGEGPGGPRGGANTWTPEEPTVETRRSLQEETDAPDPQKHPAAHDEPPERSQPLAERGVTRGKCGNCGTRLKLSDRRPVKAICPECGRSRVLDR